MDPQWKVARQAATLLEEAENVLEATDNLKYSALARDIRTLEIELLRFALDDREES